MKQKIFIKLFLAITSFLAVPLLSKAQETTGQQSLLWEITGKNLKEPSYLYGTIHAICKEDMVISDVLKDKFQKSSQLALEVDMDDPALLFTMQKGLMMSRGQTLKTIMKEKEFSALQSFFKDSLKMDIAPLMSFKPFFLQSMMIGKLLGCPHQAYETVFMDMAKDQKIEILGLETAQDQMDRVDKIPQEIHVKMLVEMIGDFNKAQKEMRNMINVYKLQNVDSLATYMSKEMTGMGNFEEVLLTERNNNWIPVIIKMAGEKPTFFAVGAGHLGGQNGVIELLRREGYTVKPLK